MTDWLKVILAVAPRAKAAIAQGLADAMPDIVSRWSVETALDQAHFLAQTAHEGDGFRTTVEYASGDAYDTRIDLGFTKAKDGDGRKYKGFGLIQETGPTNQRAAANALGILDKWKANPRVLAAMPWAALSAAYYWKAHGISALANRDDVNAVTRKVNGGLNGLADRKTYLSRAKIALGVDGAEEEGPEPLPREKVRALQVALSPAYPLGDCDGKIGSLTVAAISAFQNDSGLPVTGAFDPATIAAIEEGVEPRPVAPKRANGKPAGSAVLTHAKTLKLSALGLCAPAAGKLADDPLGSLETAGGYWTRAKAALQPFDGIADTIGAHWPVAVIAAAAAVFVLATKIEGARIADYRAGRTP